MAIKGSLREASLPDVLQLLALGQKTGCLAVSHRNNFGAIYFDKGRISFASIVNRRDRLGDTLVKSGKLTQAQLDAAIEEQSHERDMRLGDILVRQGVLTREQLNDQIRVQIEEAVYFLFTWNEGTFNFEPDVRAEMQDFLVSIRPDALLLEGARRVDEWSLIEKKIPTFDLIFDVDRDRLRDSGVELTKEQEAVVALIDGMRNVQQIAEESGLVEFETAKSLYGLATAGFLHRVGSSRQNDPKASADRVEENRNLGIAFYKTGMLDEAMREFRRVTDLRPGDDLARFYIGLTLLRMGKWSDAANALHEVAAPRLAKGAVFHNMAYALERLGRYDEAHAALEQAQKRGLMRDPRVRTSMGIVALRQGQVVQADRLLSAARALFAPKKPTGAWYLAASLAASLQGHLERAAELLEEGAGEHPNTPVLRNNLAVVYQRLGRLDDALGCTERGLEIDANLPQLHKNRGDLERQAGREEEAMEAYQRAVKSDPQLGADVYYQIGTLHSNRAEREDAVRAWEQALSIDPSHEMVRLSLETARER
jgi:tetratricopeptide (TPR) repeat protein